MPKSSRRRKRRDTWGSISYDPKRQVGVIRYWASTDERGYMRHCKTVHGTRQEVEMARAALMLDHSADAPCPTVGQAWERWCLPDIERMVEGGDLSKQTMKTRRSAWRNHVAPTWADVPCDQVRPLAIQQWISGLGYSQAMSAVAVLRAVMDYAVRYELVSGNPMREKYVMPSKSTVVGYDKGTWTLDELGTLWRECAYGQWWEAAFLLAAFGGMRVGESLGVTSSDLSTVEFHRQRILVANVSRQVSNDGMVTDRLKTRWSARPVAIPGRAADRLLCLSESAPGGWLTGDGMGNPTKQRILVTSWTSACQHVDQSLRHPFKNLRNSWQTNMRWSLRLPPWLIEPMMGHVGEGTTGQHYDRPRAEMFAEAVADAYASNPFDARWNWVS